ncbi:ATP-grasp domain-containing protein [Enterococcus sp.]|uniref:ATP-grasp domain-containing protein n=1 Tax=Enterococcus sp. TaxID=35783 RepID=UPI0028983A55|nr:ATP-grasp domain-containing protein [Enterococcus sp.]
MDAIICISGIVLHKNPEYINFFKKRGIKILVLDTPSYILSKIYKGYNEAENHFSYIEECFIFENKYDSFNKCIEWGNLYNIVAVINFKDDFVKEADIIKNLVKCVGPGTLSSVICSNKYLQRSMLTEFSPASQRVVLSEYIEIINDSHFPFVVKPIVGSSSKNVFLIRNEKDLSKIPRTMVSTEVLIEEYVEGDEFSCESIVFNGEIIFNGITGKITNENETNFFAEVGHTVPAQNISENNKRQLLNVNKAIVEKIEFEYGIAHAEYKIDSKGKVKLMEIACRPPGDAIIDLYSRSYSVDFPSMILKCLSRDYSIVNDLKNLSAKYVSHQRYLSHPMGILKTINTSLKQVWFYEIDREMYKNYEFSKLSICEPYLYVYRQRGDILTNIRNSYDRSAAIVFTCQRYETIEEIVENLEGKVTIEVMTEK